MEPTRDSEIDPEAFDAAMESYASEEGDDLLRAKLYKDGLLIATGKALFPRRQEHAEFWPDDVARLSQIPSGPSTLKLSDKEVWEVDGFHPAKDCVLRWELPLAAQK